MDIADNTTEEVSQEELKARKRQELKEQLEKSKELRKQDNNNFKSM